MFVGALNQTVRKYLVRLAPVVDGREVAIGCSGNFTSEAVFSQFAPLARLHSNDVSFYSCMIGRWITGRPLDFEIVDEGYNWLERFFATETSKLASILVLVDMLEFDKRNHIHRQRMWNLYRESFDDLVDETMGHLNTINFNVASFYEGDVLDHFQRFDGDAVFCCYAPTYAGGYERLYRRMDEIFQWKSPSYEMLNDERRSELLDWMRERHYLWYDDRELPGLCPQMKQRAGRSKDVFLYTNLPCSDALFDDRQPQPLPPFPIAGESFEIRPKSKIWLNQIKTTELGLFKDIYLNKNIDPGRGMWAFAVIIDGLVIGFLEYERHYTAGALYLMSDFPVTTQYIRLSKLITALAIAGETRKLVERLNQNRVYRISTTAFTRRSVSMKYRGILNLLKRGETEDGQPFLNYGAEFNDLSWKQTLARWKQKHLLKTR